MDVQQYECENKSRSLIIASKHDNVVIFLKKKLQKIAQKKYISKLQQRVEKYGLTDIPTIKHSWMIYSINLALRINSFLWIRLSSEIRCQMPDV